MWIRPSTLMVTNQTSITGPNSLATLAVPRDWIRNRPIRMKTEAKVMTFWLAKLSRPCTSCSPWKAPKTEMAGVMMLSP